MLLQRMKFAILLGCVSPLVIPANGGETILGESRIDKVTVMADRAEVSRWVSATVPKGESIVVVDGLLKSLDERTLRAEDLRGVVVQGIGSDIVKRKVMPPTDKAVLIKHLNEMQGRIEAINASVLGLRRQVELARSYRSRTLDAIGLQSMLPGEKLPQGKLDLDSWGRALDALSEQESQALSKTRDMEVERFNLGQEIQDIQQQLKHHDEPRVEEVRRALLGVSSPLGGPISFQLVYRLVGPTWRVHYNLRYNTKKELLTVETFGVILQETGEDWKDVELVLSTRIPVSGLRAPPSQTLVLEGQNTQTIQQELATYAEHISASKVASVSKPNEEVIAPGVQQPQQTDDVEQPTPIQVAAARGWNKKSGLEDFIALQSSLTGQFFKVLKKSTILSGEGTQQVSISRAEVVANLNFECVPKHSGTVYRRVTAKNTSGSPLLAGRAALFLDGGLVGISFTPAIPPGEDLALSFGALEGLSVASSAESGEDALPGEIEEPQKGRRTYHFTNLYELYNRTGKDFQVRLLDTVPLSEAKEVEVGIDIKKSSKFTDLGNGILSFQVMAEPKKVGKINLYYSVTLPVNLKF